LDARRQILSHDRVQTIPDASCVALTHEGAIR
jgi:hypothetical protein